MKKVKYTIKCYSQKGSKVTNSSELHTQTPAHASVHCECVKLFALRCVCVNIWIEYILFSTSLSGVRKAAPGFAKTRWRRRNQQHMVPLTNHFLYLRNHTSWLANEMSYGLPNRLFWLFMPDEVSNELQIRVKYPICTPVSTNRNRSKEFWQAPQRDCFRFDLSVRNW